MPNLKERLQELAETFIANEIPRESYADKGDALLKYILEHERLIHGVADNPDMWDMVDKETIRKMSEWDSDNPGYSTDEKVFRRLATGRQIEGIKLSEDAIKQRTEKFSALQSSHAKKRRPSSFNKQLYEIVLKNPAISAKELHRELEKRKDIIADYDEQTLCTAEGEQIKTSGLKDRLSRAKKKFALAG